jgi:mono/diheme cytochrome c family protein
MNIGRILQLPVAAAALAFGALTLLSSARGMTDPASPDQPDGAAIYARRCAICHAKDGTGVPKWREKGQPSFSDSAWQSSHSDSKISEVIKGGKGKYMPPFKEKLSDKEVSALVAQIRHFGK